MNIDRVKESEMHVLGTCINDNEYLVNVMDKLTEENFYSIKHRLIFKAMKELYVEDIKFDLSILITKLIKEINAGAINITEITEIATHIAFNAFSSHIDLIKNESNMRVIKAVCFKVVNSEVTVEESIEILQNTLLQLHMYKEKDKVYSLSEMLEKTIQRIEKAYNSKDGLTGIATGVKHIDIVTNGFQKKEFIMFAGRPSMGKTALSLKVLQNIKGNVLYIQSDMSLEGMGERMLAFNSSIENGRVGRGKLNDKEWEVLSREFSKLANKKNIFFYETSSISINKLRNVVKSTQIKHGLDVIIVDHVGKVDGNGKDAYEKASNVSKGLKALAIELNIAVVGLAQLNRDCEKRLDKRPLLSDLRDSGRYEEDADVIGMLYREGYYKERIDGDNITDDILEIDFQKVRNGKTGKIEMRYNLKTQQLSELYK